MCPLQSLCRSSPSPLPVRSATGALQLIEAAATRPLVHETIAFLLDHDGFGSTLLCVSGTDRPDAMLGVVECVARAGEGIARLASIVVASIRPAGGLVPGDVDRWLEASDLADQHGLRLVEWFVIGPNGPECPRDLIGEPERWPG